MAKLAEARELFSQNRFEEALGLFQFVAQDNQRESEERLEAFESLLTIFSSLGKKTELVKTQRQFVKYLIEQKKISLAQDIAETIIQNENQAHLEDVYSLWLCLALNGEVGRAEKLGERYLEALYQKKNFQKGLLFVDEVEQRLAQVELALYYRIKFLDLKKDYESLNTILVQNKAILSSQVKIEKSLYLKKCAKYILGIKPKDSYPQLSQVLAEVALVLLSERGTGKRLNDYQKNLIHTLFELLLIKNIDVDCFKIILNYCRLYHRGYLVQALIDVVSLQPQLIRGQKKLSKIFEDIKIEMVNWPNYDNVDQSVDLAQDLFENPAEESRADAIRRLEKDIEILKKKNLFNDIESFLGKLKKLDPKHPLLNQKQQENKINKNEVHRSISEVMSHNGKQDNNDKMMLASFRKHLAYLDKEFVKSNFRDLTVSLFGFEAWELAIEFLENTRAVLDEEDNWERKLSLEYLYIVACEKMGRDYQVLIALDNVLQSFPILEEEKVLFFYLKGEVCKRMGRKLEALTAFRWVEKHDSHYRLVQQRIRELAQG